MKLQTQSTPFGQWIGKFNSDSVPGYEQYEFRGNATFNIESDYPSRGFACVDQGANLHGTRKDFELKIKGNQFVGHSTDTRAFDWERREIIPVKESLKRQRVKNEQIFYLIDIEIFEGSIDEKSLKCKWRANHNGIPIEGKFEGQKLGQDESNPCDKEMSWEEFKDFVGKFVKSSQQLIFRGQCSNKYRLTTTFHRQNRYDLLRYENEACAQLFQHINGISARQYDPKNQVDFGGILSLAQHHGFPTPLLDWSKSPYIAAYFAFENNSTANALNDAARIYIFDVVNWQRDTTQEAHFADPRPVVTYREFIASNNPRHLPQQSVHTFTNIGDVEAWIRLLERERQKKYMTIVDIPHSEREFAMRDLAFMGVTAAALYPGLDGVCRFLKEKFFPPR